MDKLLSSYQNGKLNLKNHLVMSPMTRSRAIDNIPNDLMAEYYGQRTGAGFIITEGTAPVPEALGYPRIPGIFNQEQIEGWKKVTTRIHQDDSKTFLQLMHTGRIGHTDNLPKGITLVGPTGQKAAGQIFTDTKGPQDHSEPQPLSQEGIDRVIEGFVTAAQNAVEAGFDGVEIHGANGYLLEQFLNPKVNTRTDEYGGSVTNRIRLTLNVVQAVAMAIGKEKVGIRLSPYSTLLDLPEYDSEATNQTYNQLAFELDNLDIAYIHIAVNAEIPQKTFRGIRQNFSGTIILANGLSPEKGEEALHDDFADLVGFGRLFLANPDFVERIKGKAALNPVDYSTLYTPGSKGYTDYAALDAVVA